MTPTPTAARTCNTVQDRVTPRRDRIAAALAGLDRPVRLRPGQVITCTTCGRDTAGQQTARRLGITQHCSGGVCDTCAGATKRAATRAVEPTAARPRPGWQRHAACVGADPTLFDIVERVHNPPVEVVFAAIRYCAGCPSRAACNEEAEAGQLLGLWSGKWRSGHGQDHRARDLLDRAWLRGGAA